MSQVELPLVYPRVHQIEEQKKYKLPTLWKAVFVLLIFYSLAISTITYVRATQARSALVETKVEAVQVPAISAITASETASGTVPNARVKMTAGVRGWYDVEKIDNTNIHVKTNMKVWVNGREFVRCNDCEQEKINLSMLDF